jgi:sirohydrochlorin cobaltochelatase
MRLVKTHVVLCGHGTRHADGAAQFVAVADAVRQRLAHLPIHHAFMELSPPLLSDVLDNLYGQGVRSMLVIPGMLFCAGHAKTDIPALMRGWQVDHADAALLYGRPLGVDPQMLRAAGDRIEQALAGVSAGPRRDETLLLVIGRGSSDPDANADLAKVARLLWEGLGFGRGEVGYCDVTFPRIDAALDHAASQGFRRIVISPYLLFTGVLVHRLNGLVAAARERYPTIEFVIANFLSDHEGVVATFADRIQEGLTGEAAMNCRMCKHRAPVLAFNSEVGVPQLGDDDPRHHPASHPFAGHRHGPRGG